MVTDFDPTNLDSLFVQPISEEELRDMIPTQIQIEITNEHVSFDANAIRAILNVVSKVQTTGSNMYDHSILILRVQDTTDYKIIFSSFGILYQSVLKSNTPSVDKLTSKAMLLNISSLMTMCRYVGNNLILYVTDSNIQVQVLGGMVDVSGQLGADLKPYELPASELHDVLSSQYVSKQIVTNHLIQSLKLIHLSRSCASPTQRMLFLTDDSALVHTGSITAKILGEMYNVTIQPKGVGALEKFLPSSPAELMIKESRTNVLFYHGDTYLMISKVGDTLPEAVIKLISHTSDVKNSIQSRMLTGIVDVLTASGSVSGNVEFTLYENGVKIVSRSVRSVDGSVFNMGEVSGPSRNSVQISLSALTKTVSLFKGAVNIGCWVNGDTLYLSSDLITVAIMARSDERNS